MNCFARNLIHFLVGSAILTIGGSVLWALHWTIMNHWYIPAAVFVGAVAWLLGLMYYKMY